MLHFQFEQPSHLIQILTVMFNVLSDIHIEAYFIFKCSICDILCTKYSALLIHNFSLTYKVYCFYYVNKLCIYE